MSDAAPQPAAPQYGAPQPAAAEAGAPQPAVAGAAAAHAAAPQPGFRQSGAARGVLITRPAAEAGPTAARLAALGWEPIVAPFMVITHHSFAMPEHLQAALVTSGNALPALGGLAVPMLTVGDATAARARAAGHGDVRSAAGDATALLQLATETLDPAGAPLLLASGVNQGENLAAHLRARGFRVIRRIAYAANPPHTFPPAAAAALQTNALHAAMFMSAETAKHFVNLLPPALHETVRNIIALAIGTPAADALNPLPWRQVRLARSPSLDEVLTLL